jgi:hypothetical protein
VAVAVPSAAVISEAEGLQPRVTEAGVIIIAGALGALNQVTVLEVVAVLPHSSMAVNVLVCEELHEVVDTAPSLNVIVGVPQPSVAVAVPSAAVISEAEGLQPSDVAVPVAVITGGVRSLTQVTVLVVVALFPHPSTAVKVLVCEELHEVVDTAPSLNVIVVVPQPSVAVAVPNAAVISEAEGLQPSDVAVPVAVIDGGVRSAVHVTVLAAVAELPQPSDAVNVLVCDCEQLLVCTAPSVNVIIGVLQAAVAVAVPSAAVISEAEGLQPRVTEAGVIIIAGALGALSQVTVLVVVALLPQASIAVNVLVCEELHEVVDTAPSLNVIVGVPQPSVAVAVPSAAMISEAEGLQPSDVAVPVAVITGGVRSLTHVTVLVVVALFPHPSTAVKVLVCEDEHEVVDTAPSLNVIVVVPQPSVAVAVPNAAVISEAEGLQPSDVAVPVAVIDGGVRSAVHVTVLTAVALLPHPSTAVNVLV